VLVQRRARRDHTVLPQPAVLRPPPAFAVAHWPRTPAAKQSGGTAHKPLPPPGPDRRLPLPSLVVLAFGRHCWQRKGNSSCAHQERASSLKRQPRDDRRHSIIRQQVPGRCCRLNAGGVGFHTSHQVMCAWGGCGDAELERRTDRERRRNGIITNV